MLPETLPVKGDLPLKFASKLDGVDTLFDRFIAQHLYDGEIQLANKSARTMMTKKIYVEKKSGAYTAPARYRGVDGPEGRELWEVQVWKEYWHTMWLRAQSVFNLHMGKANEIKRRIGDYDESAVDQIEDQYVRASVAEISRAKTIAASALKDAKAAQANMEACRQYLISVAAQARKASEAAEVDAKDKALIEEEVRREKAKASAKRELTAAAKA